MNKDTISCCKKNEIVPCCKNNDITLNIDYSDNNENNLINTNEVNVINDNEINPQNINILNKLTLFYPLIITFLFVISGAIVTQYPISTFNSKHFMSNLMGILLITFSYLKMLNLKGFAISFSKYDFIAYYIWPYGYIYPLTELTLGLFYCVKLYPVIINSITIFFLTINFIEVSYALILKKELECACMGSLGFKLPLSYITITEDIFMIIMSIIMISIN